MTMQPQNRRWVIWCGSALAAAAALPGNAAEMNKTWATRDYLHFDRTASPWLIKRFIDRQARFIFLPWDKLDEVPKDAIRFAMPGADLGPHDKAGTTFEKLKAKYELRDPALDAMARVIAAGVDFVLHGVRPPAGDKYGEMAYGLMALSDGMMLVNKTDEENLELALRNWDAIYATIKANLLVEAKGLSIPPPNGQGPRPKTLFLRGVLAASDSPVK